jgi:hypothetical protein
MSEHSRDNAADAAMSRKLLRFGTDRPRCAKCKSNDIRTLCRVQRQGKASAIILCRNCKEQRRKVSARAASRKAQRFTAEGYVKPSCIICKTPTLQILELDHLANEANSDLTEPLCANHHAMKSYAAETGPMAALRLRDPDRRALVLQAAFEIGLGTICALWAAWDGANDEMARAVFLGLVSASLFAWAAWNLGADEHFVRVLGSDYDRAIPAWTLQ